MKTAEELGLPLEKVGAENMQENPFYPNAPSGLLHLPQPRPGQVTELYSYPNGGPATTTMMIT
jgi:hypothetical protein